MILDIENIDGEKLRISYFNDDGEIDFLHLPIPPSERFVWQEYDKLEQNPRYKGTPDPVIKTWDNQQVRKARTNRINKYRIEEILAITDPEETAPLWEFKEPQKYFMDIEVEIKDGFPDAESAKTPVTSISVVGEKGNNITLGLKELSPKQQARIENEINKHFEPIGKKFTFQYKQCKDEYDLLYEFFGKIIKKIPCLSGWNFINYDWKYLLNRAKKLQIDPGMASPSGKLIGRYSLPQHRLIVDYLEIYKKWDRVIKIKESNKLDYVAEAALGIKKLNYPGSLKELYEKDFEKFIQYNAIDTNLVLCIDEKLQTMKTFFKLAHISGVEINRTFSPVWITEALMTRQFLAREKVFVWKEKDQDHVHYEGAYVKEPIKGMHKHIACYDFASLYPNTMIQWGISPESYQGKDLVNPDSKLTKSASGAFFDQSTTDPVMKVMLGDFYEKRKIAKKDYLQVQKEIDYLKKKL